MARSLARNTRLIVSTQSPDLLIPANCDTTNTFEVKVLDGYSFSQDASTQEVGVNEAGTSPVRGTLGFNTALNPVDVSFSTYVRAYVNPSDLDGTVANSADCIERPLWASAMGTQASWDTSIVTPAVGEIFEAQSATALTLGLGSSNNNELLNLYLYFVLENTTYVVQDFTTSTAEVDFSIDGIAAINWSGFGSRLNENESVHARITDTGDANYLTSSLDSTGDYLGVPATTTATFLRNKLSTIELKDNSIETVPTLDNDAIAVGGVVGQLINLTATLTADDQAALIGGRANNINASSTENPYATIVATTASTVTVSAAEDISAWVATDIVDYYAATEHAGVIYSIPVTGATLTLENNMSYLTPEELAIVNLPLAGFAGNRIISGTFTAYLNTGASGTGGILQDLLAKIEEVSNDFELKFHMGGSATDTPRVDFVIAHAQISVPSTSVEDIISTEITFTGKPWDSTNDVASFEDTNELLITYQL
jgi:hypothetical protein